MRAAASVLLAAGLFCAPVKTHASGDARPEGVQQTQVAPSGQPDAAPSSDQSISFDERVARFVNEFYLSGEQRSDEDLERLYAASVDYFDKGRWSRERVIADKRAYYAKWTRRTYNMLRETLRVERRGGLGKVYDVAFEYTFDVGSPARVSRGRGRALLTMDLGQDGGRITRETGTVLQRW